VVASEARYPEGELGVIDLGHRNFVRLMQAPGCFTHWHDCTGPGYMHAWTWFGTCGDRQSGHKIISVEPLTVEGSLGCKHCGNHGHIRFGEWVPAG
jgi:hypothetical protein